MKRLSIYIMLSIQGVNISARHMSGSNHIDFHILSKRSYGRRCIPLAAGSLRASAATRQGGKLLTLPAVRSDFPFNGGQVQRQRGAGRDG